MDHDAGVRNLLEHMLEDGSAEPTDLPLSLLKDITNKFADDQQIGRGGFAVVYKGQLKNGTVAVKKLLQTLDMDEQKYSQEVACLTIVKHKNIIRFLGYCADTQGKIWKYEGKPIMADIRERLLCFEYIPKGSLDKYIKDLSHGLEWRTCYQIIKGICEGLHYLHQKNIVHLDLKPANILLDDNMVPKIADFGLARCFDEDQSRAITSTLVGSLGYLAPEFYSGVITLKSDIYSLGVIIIEILTGQKGYPMIEHVLESWSNRMEISQGDTRLEHIRVCAEMGIECIDPNPMKRPVTQRIIEMLEEKESTYGFIKTDLSTSWPTHVKVDSLQQAEKASNQLQQGTPMVPGDKSSEVSPWSTESELLDIYPSELRFPFEPSKRIRCTLSLTNKTGDGITFYIIPKYPERYVGVKELSGLVPPHFTCAVRVTMKEQQQPPPSMDEFQIKMVPSRSTSVPNSNRNHQRHLRTPNNSDLGNKRDRMSLVAVICDTGPEGKALKQSASQSQTLEMKNYGELIYVKSMDVHPTEPWVVTAYEGRGHWGTAGSVYFWNNKTHGMGYGFDYLCVSIKFIARRQWVVSGDTRGNIHVYTYVDYRLKEFKKFKAHGDTVRSLAVHPTQPYLLSASDDHQIKLWDWDKGWVCTREFQGHTSAVHQVAFNPKDTNTFVSVSTRFTLPGSIKIWSVSSANPNIDRSVKVNSVAYYVTAGSGRQYMAISLLGGRTKILDVQSKTYVHTLEPIGTKATAVVAVDCHPTLPILVTGTSDGEVFLWNCTTYRLMQTLWFRNGEVKGFGFMEVEGLTRLVIGYANRIEIVEINWPALAGQL